MTNKKDNHMVLTVHESREEIGQVVFGFHVFQNYCREEGGQFLREVSRMRGEVEYQRGEKKKKTGEGC